MLREMARDVTGMHIDKTNVVNGQLNDHISSQMSGQSNVVNIKSNGIWHDTVHVVSKKSGGNAESKSCEVESHPASDSIAKDFHEKEVFGVKSTNFEPRLPEMKTSKTEVLKSCDKKFISPLRTSSGSAAGENLPANSSVFPIPDITNEKRDLSEALCIVADTIGTVSKYTSTNELGSPNSEKPKSPSMLRKPRKPLQFDEKNHPDEEDNFSIASSTATSVRTMKFKVTVPVGPSFKCVERIEKRREFYTKLGEKHQALEAEKHEIEARTKEDEAAAIKQLRKSMAYKANPVPSFYSEGPPPKAELKKLPVTRAKSPNFTRRKSCGDAVSSRPVEKGTCGRASRHSTGTGTYREGSSTISTPKSKNQNNGHNGNGSIKAKERPKQVRETTQPASHKMTRQNNAGVAVQ